MTLDDETAANLAREVVGGGRAARVYPHSTDVALVRAGYAARDAEVEELRAERDQARAELRDAFRVDIPSLRAERDKARAEVEELRAAVRWAKEAARQRKERAEKAEAALAKIREYVPRLQTNRAQADLRAILDESPPEWETSADEGRE